jgi:hypothetical protein
MGLRVASDRILHIWADDRDGVLCTASIDADVGAFLERGKADAEKLAVTFNHRKLCQRCVKKAGW